jgi:tRNA(Ile)-lysidine synthase
VGASEFARLMAGLGAFESRPLIAVAVSGGADSMALALLCHHWANAQGGRVFALSVDHRLRPESAAELRQVKRWLALHGIAHVSLAWNRVRRPASALQKQARAARYALMTAWCRRRGALHLALAHHAGDQAETVLMRLARGGIDGLAGISAIASRDGVRLIRPLLAVEPGRLRATLHAAKQDWIEDPSNSNPAFERVRWRSLIAPALIGEIAAAAAAIGRERQRREQAVADLLATARIDPAGFLVMPFAGWAAAPAALAERALGRCVIAIAGEDYAPHQESLARLSAELAGGKRGATLGGCRILRRRDDLYVFREPAAAERLGIRAGGKAMWDGRFEITSAAAGTLAVLGEPGWARLPKSRRPASLPRDCALALPALWRSGRPVSLFLSGNGRNKARFRPGQPLAPCGFTVVK